MEAPQPEGGSGRESEVRMKEMLGPQNLGCKARQIVGQWVKDFSAIFVGDAETTNENV